MSRKFLFTRVFFFDKMIDVKFMGNKSIVNEDSKKKGFWQRHPVLRTLLTIFLCLLLVGVIMVAVYHIVKAVQNSKKDDEIKKADEAGEKLKKSTNKLTDEQQEKLKNGELTSEKVKEDLKKEQAEAKDAQDMSNKFNAYKNSTDTRERAEIVNNYANSQKEALQNGKLKYEDLKKIAEKEKNDFDAATEAKDGSYDNLTKDNDFTVAQATEIEKGDSPTTTLESSDVTNYNSYKTAVEKLKNATASSTSTDKLFTDEEVKQIIDGKIKSSDKTLSSDKQTIVKDFENSGVLDNDNNIIGNTKYAMTNDQKEAIHYGTFDTASDKVNIALSDKQQGLIDDYKAKNETLKNEQVEAGYAKRRFNDALAYENALESEKEIKLKDFGDNEGEAMRDNSEVLSKYYDDKFTAENNDVKQTNELLKNIEDVENNQAKLQQIAKDNGVTNASSLDDIKSGIEKNYDSKTPASDGALRITGDALLAAGAFGAICTGIYSAVQSSLDNSEEKVEDAKKEENKDINNDDAENGTKQYYSQTTTTVSK